MDKKLVYLVLLLIITDIVVLADVPLLRQSLPFIFFNIIPGFLLLRALGVDLKFLEESILSVALSVALLMFLGFIVNSFYPIIPKPLSLMPILVSVNVLVIILLSICYLKDRPISFKVRWGTNSPVIFFPLFFPILTILGSLVMNFYSNGTVLVFMLLLIPAFVTFLTLNGEKIHPNVYPISLYCFAFSLLAMNTLPSNYLIGRDIHWEYYWFKVAFQNSHWNMYVPFSLPHPTYNSCLSITILPIIYKYLLNITPLYVFKLYYCIIGAVGPLSAYLVAERILKDRLMAFYTASLFFSQFSYIYMGGWCRQLIGFVFFAAAIMVITSPIKGAYKKILFLFFIIASVLSHYATSYAFLIIVASAPFIVWFNREWLNRRFPSLNTPTFTNRNLAILFFIIVFAWYAQATEAPFKDLLRVIIETLKSMANFFSPALRNYSEQSVLGVGLAQIPEILSVSVHDIVFVLLGLGALTLFFKSEYRKRYKVDSEYIASTIIILAFLTSFVIFPYISQAYGGKRLYTQFLVILGPCFIIRVQLLVDQIKRFTPSINGEALKKIMILSIFILGFSCTTYLQYHFCGIPHSYAYDNVSERRYETFIYDSEVTGAKWLNYYGNRSLVIHCDRVGFTRLLLGFDTLPNRNRSFFNDTNNTGIFGGYVYLRHFNINEGLVLKNYPIIPPRIVNGTLNINNVEDIRKYSRLLDWRNVIYDNGGSRILI